MNELLTKMQNTPLYAKRINNLHAPFGVQLLILPLENKFHFFFLLFSFDAVGTAAGQLGHRYILCTLLNVVPLFAYVGTWVRRYTLLSPVYFSRLLERGETYGSRKHRIEKKRHH